MSRMPVLMIVLAVAIFFLLPRPQPDYRLPESPSGYVLAVNNYQDDRYQVLFFNPDGSVPAQAMGCEAIWTYGARENAVFAVVLAEARADNSTYQGTWCRPGAEEQSAPVTPAIYDSYAGFGPDGAVVTGIHSGDRTDLYRIDPDGSAPTRLTWEGSINSDADWSPDGARIVFRSNRSGAAELWMLHLASGEFLRLTNDPDNDAGSYGGEGPARFSPDGTKIAWGCSDANGDTQLCVMRVDGSGRRQLDRGELLGRAVYPSWHPSGNRLVFGQTVENGFALYEIDLAGGEPRRVANQPEGSNLAAVWVRM